MGLDQPELSGVTSLYIPEQLQLTGLLNRQRGVPLPSLIHIKRRRQTYFALRLPIHCQKIQHTTKLGSHQNMLNLWIGFFSIYP